MGVPAGGAGVLLGGGGSGLGNPELALHSLAGLIEEVSGSGRQAVTGCARSVPAGRFGLGV